MAQTRILVVDDEERIRRLVRMYLERNGFEVDEAADGKEALHKALNQAYALIILDLMLPGMDGRDVCAQIRQHSNVPIMMLTAAGDEANRVHGFELGADDYVVKPFSPRELVLRVKAMLKRTGEMEYARNAIQTLTFPGLEIQIDARRVEVNGQEVNLTPKEFDLLVYMAQRPDKVFSREELLRDVWNYQFFGDQRTVDTHIKRLREKLGQASPEVSRYIVTVWGVGYKFEVAS
ncbi:response regulator transcription factor [Alicyclobacillus acidocaldarius]|uniref:Two component transcriptional regulator, winged helix family n=1 Tax=Alicyclobacillus acidocaldarius subsp. acidocaldarius (strain ATCC 27009 / DSM 446 / BCRC 14685 / JCM 5260 / KCTC 1825 / NBRC 15652 / NCIMB 11725 / NRRL B-14509 / 104-IA) TaxID=521098 RepID=C8WXB8_ALIAD|nr:response regulator transcription factor [Alicyclobacillus acidocaldarius]ACV58740.1 two component transcriptional regulator, winged helix family [Alicyclobacillus acidocaldarius subsp. acidocaldarius DSM 446]